MADESQDTEHVVARLRPHGRALFWPSLVLIVVVGLMTYFSGSFSETWENIAVLAGGALLILLLWLLPLLSWLGKRYIITSRRIILRSGFFVRMRQELLHSRGYDITVRKAGLQSLFGSGNVLINAGLDHPVVLKDVPSADLVQSSLHDLMEKSLNPIAARRQAEASRPGYVAPPDLDETTAWGTR
ncbi:PH domain-containing protein [Lacisediminihabitans changchengi]|uniref:PH domain-containing protein n=1 Tax=Lacisediminihabitans changchengi TaxID=2787634 RepID=A0A934W4E9_9MICO|nr:PH domain-containing protein [Lacisediminihabitans changchengi]MBK4348886.1 PH domain-containing protein [Lacisediminihabitans changchengi]